MKRFLRINILVIAMFTFLISAQPFSAFAFETFNNHRLINGVGNYGNNNQYYFITGSASGYSSLITEAMNDWIYTSDKVYTPISFLKTTNQPASVIDVHAGYYYDQSLGILGETEFFVGSTKLNPSSQNWYWTNVKLNRPNFDSLSTFHRKGTIAHEMGHAMGLAHSNYNPNVIMAQYGAGRTVNECQVDDLNGINHLY